MLYFAYGSNLSPARLRQRVPSADLLTTARLTQHRLLFHKIGRDGSAKCNACYTGQSGDIVLGAVYRIDPAHRFLLDAAEGAGRGYDTKKVNLVTDPGDAIQAFTYFATRITCAIRPFRWYREHVLRGARELGFSKEYIQAIEAISADADTDAEREERELSIYR